MSRRFWPVAEAAQADYEGLRRAALHGEPCPSELAALRFARRGLAGLIAWPAAEPLWLPQMVGAERPAWCGHEDPREEAFCEVYGFLLARAPRGASVQAVAR